MNKKNDRGQGLIEYLLLVALVAASGMVAMSATGSSISDVFCGIAGSLGGGGGACSEGYFFDGFDADLDQWDRISGNWNLKDGQMCVGPGGEGKIATDIDQSDYVINLRGADLSKGNGFGVFFRTSNHENMNGYSFQVDPGYGGGEFIMRKWANGNEFSPFARQKAPEFDWYSPHDVKIVVRGESFEAYMDNVLVLSGSDSTYSEGGMGLRVWDSTEACFDEVSVEPIP